MRVGVLLRGARARLLSLFFLWVGRGCCPLVLFGRRLWLPLLVRVRAAEGGGCAGWSSCLTESSPAAVS